jgi:hypothetical protein
MLKVGFSLLHLLVFGRKPYSLMVCLETKKLNTETKLVRCFRSAPAVLAITIGVASFASTAQAQTISPYAATQKQNMGNNRYKVLGGGAKFDMNTILVQFNPGSTDFERDGC